MTPDQLAEAPPNDPTHPAVIERVTEEMLATARLLDHLDARSFAADGPWKALQFLRCSVDKLVDEAEMYRPVSRG